MGSSVIKPELVVMALLLQYPEMAEIVEEKPPDWSQVVFSTKEGLLDILRTIDRFQPANTARLLEVYREDAEKFDWLSRLANKEVIPFEGKDFDVRAEFAGALERVVALGKKRYFDELMDKSLK